MKLKLFVLFITVLIFSRCEQYRTSRINGAWQIMEATYTQDGEITVLYPELLKGNQLKTFNNNYFTFTGHFWDDSSEFDNYGWGTFQFDGKHYKEINEYHTFDDYRDKTAEMIIEIHGDTLIQIWPVNETGEVDSMNFNVEKYLRLKTQKRKS